jgi:hypothetical protein
MQNTAYIYKAALIIRNAALILSHKGAMLNMEYSCIHKVAIKSEFMISVQFIFETSGEERKFSPELQLFSSVPSCWLQCSFDLERALSGNTPRVL